MVNTKAMVIVQIIKEDYICFRFIFSNNEDKKLFDIPVEGGRKICIVKC